MTAVNKPLRLRVSLRLLELIDTRVAWSGMPIRGDGAAARRQRTVDKRPALLPAEGAIRGWRPISYPVRARHTLAMPLVIRERSAIERTRAAAASALIVDPIWQWQTMLWSCQSVSSKKRLASP
jgi:hypothetical protein